MTVITVIAILFAKSQSEIALFRSAPAGSGAQGLTTMKHCCHKISSLMVLAMILALSGFMKLAPVEQ